MQLGKPCARSYLHAPEPPLDAVEAFEEVFGAQPAQDVDIDGLDGLDIDGLMDHVDIDVDIDGAFGQSSC